MLQYDVVDLEPDELRLLFNSWLKSNRAAHPDQTDKAYYARQHELIVDILADLPLLLAARSEGVVLGWLCARPTDDGVLVDYCYVKSSYRRFGIARRLLRESLARLDDCSGEGLLHSHMPAPHEPWASTKLDELGFEYAPATMTARPA